MLGIFIWFIYSSDMPELPEVHTTVSGLQTHVVNLTIKDIWSNYNSPYFKGSETIKDPEYFKLFKKKVLDQRIIQATRRAKNILIKLENGSTILIHLKMTGHLLYGKYKFDSKNKSDPWSPISPESLKDPYNRRVRFILSLSNGHFLALSDVRRFAKVTLFESDKHKDEHFKDFGPEPLEKSFDLNEFVARLKLKPRGKIKQVLMDQNIIAGIGNIYADESLWRAGINPLEKVADIKPAKMKMLFDAVKKTLARGIDFGGDSTSDYRNIHGEKGKFHETHRAYQRKGEKCTKKGCDGMIVRIVIGSRSAHYCNKHQMK